MKIRALKYTLAFLLPISVVVSFYNEGWQTFIPFFYAFGLIPLVELFLKPRPENLSEAEKELVKKDRVYDWFIYAMVPIQYSILVLFLIAQSSVDISSVEFWGRTLSMGLMCGVIGINVGHELGHRVKKFEQRLAKVLLASSLYTHFYIEHNYGHHRNVSTPEDPASARYNELLYTFWFRSIIFSYLDAWKIQMQMLRAKKTSFWSLKNQMLLFLIAQLVMLVVVFAVFGLNVLIAFIAAATIGILLLETVNYIEHYGLSRKKITLKRYETTTPAHSWNSNHVLGRMVLFELSRHSDHHANPHKPYQVLEHFDYSPQLPTGYPGMMLLAFIPPLFFKVVNPKVKALPA